METLGEKIWGHCDPNVADLEFFGAISRLLSTGEGYLRYDLLGVYIDATSTLA